MDAGTSTSNLVSPDRATLERAAALCGIELEYEDTWGHRHYASDRTLCETLAALGLPTSSTEALESTLELRELSRWARAVEPSVVVFEPGPEGAAIRIHVPEEQAGATVKLEIQWENSADVEHHWFWLPELRELERATLEGSTYLAKRLPLPASARLGYHQIRLYWVRKPELELFGEARLIVCPHRAKSLEANSRIAGVALSLYGLRSSRNWGCGDFTDLRAVVETFARAGAAFIALNPLHALPNRQPYNTSPYLPQCSLYRNFLYLDVERVPGFEAGDEGAAGDGVLEGLRATEFVEYERVAAAKLAALRKAFARFQVSAHTGGFDEYVHIEGALLHDYAVYCALDETIHRTHPNVWLWTDWPQQYRDSHSPAVEEFAAEHSDDVLFYKFLQWQIDRQLAEVQAHALASGMQIGLYHDLALATDRFGADLWANRAFYAIGARVGAPPDELAPSGQDWGFPPPDRDAHRENGYELFAQSIRKNARHGGALRIDHVMRFFRLFWIPDELTAADGTYVKDYVDDLLGVLTLESVRGGFLLIGEDLGTVAGEVRQKLREMGILGYRLLWFERNHDGWFRAPNEYPLHAAVSTSTHDLPTAAGFFAGRDIEARKEAGLIDDAAYAAQWDARREEIGKLEQVLNAAGFAGDPLGFVLATPCQLAIVNQEDLTGETSQQNLPASTWQHPNWRRKMLVTVENLEPLAQKLREKIERSHRL